MPNNIGTLVTAPIRVQADGDPISSAYAPEIQGGWHQVNTIAERDAIIPERKLDGMACYVIEMSGAYTWNSSSGWSEFSTFQTGSNDINISNMLIVDSSAPSGSGVKGSLTDRYSDILEAVVDAGNGDLILVLPGEYHLPNKISTTIAKPGLNIHFYPGTTVYFGYTPFNSTATNWIDAGGGSAPFVCSGYAKFIAYSDGVFKRFITASQNGPLNWTIECESLDTNTQPIASATGPLDANGYPISAFDEGAAIFFQDVTGANRVFVNIKKDVNLRKQAIIYQAVNGGSMRVVVDGDIITNSESYAIQARQSGLYVKCRNITSNATTATIQSGASSNGNHFFDVSESITNSSGRIVSITHSGGTYNIKAKNMTATAEAAIFMSQNSTILVEGANITSNSVSHNAIQKDTTSGNITLRNCSIVSSGIYGLATSVSSTTFNIESNTLSNKINSPGVVTNGFNVTVDQTYQGSYRFRDDLTVQSLSGNANEIVILDNFGKLVASGFTVADLSGASADMSQYITISAVANISGNLQSQIDAIVIPDTSSFATVTQVANISGNLQQQIDSLSLSDLNDVNISGVVNGQTIKYLNGVWVASPDISGAESTWGSIIGNINDQGDLISILNTKANVTEVASISGDLQQQIDAIVIPDTSSFATVTQVANISGNLQSQIDAITVPTSATFVTDYDDRYVNVTGDTIVGDINFNKDGAGFLNIIFQNNGVNNGYLYGGDGYVGIFTDSSTVGIDLDNNTNTGAIYGQWNVATGGSLSIDGVSVSVSGHTHYVNDILDASNAGKSIVKESAFTGSANNKLAKIEAGISGFYITDSNIDAGDVATDSDLLNYTLLSTAGEISGNLQQQIDAIVIPDTSSFATVTQVANISGNLQQQIDGKQNNITLVAGSGVSITESPTDTWTISVENTSGSSYGLQGRFQLSNTSNTFTITHPSINPSNEFPVCSLEVATSGSDLFIVGIHNRNSSSFQVTLSGVPTSNDYILWHISTQTSVSNASGIDVVFDTTTINDVYTLNFAGSAVVSLVDNGGGSATVNIESTSGSSILLSGTTYITGNSFTPNDDSTAYCLYLTGNSDIYCPPNMSDGQTKTIRFTQPSNNFYTINFLDNPPFYWKFSNGTDPTLTSSNGAIDVLTIIRIDKDIYGTIIKNFS